MLQKESRSMAAMRDVNAETDGHRDDSLTAAPMRPTKPPTQHRAHYCTVTFTTLGTSIETSGAAIVNSAETAAVPIALPAASTACAEAV